MKDSRPHTPIALMTSTPTHPKPIHSTTDSHFHPHLLHYDTNNKSSNNHLTSSLNNENTTNGDAPTTKFKDSIFNQLKSPLSPSNLQHSPQKINMDVKDHNSSKIELAINDILLLIDTNKPLDLVELKSVLQKCLVQLSHYKLQNEIFKYNQVENIQRNEIENEIIQKQVDHLLLKSPFNPSVDNSSSSTLNKAIILNKKAKQFKNYKVSKPKFKLVEKQPLNQSTCSNNYNNNSQASTRNSYKNTNEFNNCIKVFHLEKN